MPSYPTLNRRLPAWAEDSWRQGLSEACAAHARLRLASLVLYDVSTLYFETDKGDGFREPGFSKERRLEPQITIGLLAGQDGFPLMVEKSFRMSKSDLRARLVYHRKRDSIEAHLTVVFDALAVTRFIETRTGWFIRKLVRTARRYRTIQIRAGQHILTAEDPLPPDLRAALALIK